MYQLGRHQWLAGKIMNKFLITLESVSWEIWRHVQCRYRHLWLIAYKCSKKWKMSDSVSIVFGWGNNSLNFDLDFSNCSTDFSLFDFYDTQNKSFSFYFDFFFSFFVTVRTWNFFPTLRFLSTQENISIFQMKICCKQNMRKYEKKIIWKFFDVRLE